jgi:hypothetical protein
MTTKFVLRTTDQAWITRNGGTVDPDGRVTVHVPEAEVEPVTFAGRAWIRHHFADAPRDAQNAHIMCPAAWVA